MSDLARYNQNSLDRYTAAHDESLFGHYVEEQGWTIREALENLAPIAKRTYAETVSVASASKWLAVAGSVIGLIGGGTVGLVGALPIGAAALAFFAYREADRCVARREIELRALKNCPALLDLVYGCHLRGAETRNLIAAWDLFLDNYEESGNADANLMAREYLRILDSLSFTIEQGEVPIPQALSESNQNQSAIGQNTRLNAVEARSVQSETISSLSRSYQAKERIGLPDDLAVLAVQKPYNTLIFGQSEAGKDVTLYNVMKRNRAAHSAYFLGIDGKNHPGERALWGKDIYDDTLHFSMLDHPESYHSDLLAALKFAVQQPMSFIAFSEINGIRNAYVNSGMKVEWGLIARYIAYFALQGNANRHFLYGSVQALTLDELGLGSGDRGNIYFLAIANSTQFGFIESVGASVKVFPKALTNQAVFQSAVSRSTATQHLKNHAILKGIAYFHSAIGEWRPMPRLENPGCDRGESSPQVEPQIKPAIQPQIEAPSIESEPTQGNKEDKANIQKPNLSRTEVALAIAELGEWIDKNPGLQFSQQYANYNAARKGFSRPQFRYLLTQIEALDSA